MVPLLATWLKMIRLNQGGRPDYQSKGYFSLGTSEKYFLIIN